MDTLSDVDHSTKAMEEHCTPMTVDDVGDHLTTLHLDALLVFKTCLPLLASGHYAVFLVPTVACILGGCLELRPSPSYVWDMDRPCCSKYESNVEPGGMWL